MGNRLVAAAENEGLFVRAVGDTILFAPPLIVQEREITDIVTRFTRALGATFTR